MKSAKNTINPPFTYHDQLIYCAINGLRYIFKTVLTLNPAGKSMRANELTININEYSSSNELELLQNLLINNPELDRLEELTDQFNIFEALGAVRVELRHSDFLAYLLNPNQNHGLGSIFLRRFIETVLLEAKIEIKLRPLDIALWDLDGVEVRREWQNIDIFLLDETNKFVVIIENKIKSGESLNQLNKYLNDVAHQFIEFSIIPIFLTPDALTPSTTSYLPVSYQTICNILEQILNTRKTTMGSDIYTMVKHYTQMLRRYIVSENDISEICRSIYRKHQRALDLIYEYRPDLQGMIRDYLVEIVNQKDEFKIIRNIKSEIRFIPLYWEKIGFKYDADSLTADRLLLFYFHNTADKLSLRLVIGPGERGSRQKLLDMALDKHPPFKSSYRQLNQMWNNIYTFSILTKNDYEEPDFDGIKVKIQNAWQKFLVNDYMSIRSIIEEQTWIWE